MTDSKKTTHLKLASFIYETGIHSKTPRSGFWLLGSGSQSVAEHLFHTAMIAYALANLYPKADIGKIVLMALLHDIGEGRTSDHNYMHQRYGRLSESEAVKDLSQSVPFGKEILNLYTEEQAKVTLEAKIVKDADILEWISTLRVEEIKGNSKAKEWINIAKKGLKTKEGKSLCKSLIKMHPDEWWFNKKDPWFVHRKAKDREWQKKYGKK